MKIAGVFMGDGKLFNMNKALARLNNKNYKFINEIMDLNEANNDEGLNRLIKNSMDADLIIIHFHGSIAHLYKSNEYLNAIKGRNIFIATSLPEEIIEVNKITGLDKDLFNELYRYFLADGIDNMENFVLHASNQIMDTNYPVKEVSIGQEEGIYSLKGILDPDKEMDYIYSLSQKNNVVAVITNSAYIKNNNKEHIDQILRALRSKGLEPICIFSSLGPKYGKDSGIAACMDRYLQIDNRSFIKCIIMVTGFSITSHTYPGDGNLINEASIFEKWDLPVIQAITLYRDMEGYISQVNGMDIPSISLNVYQPEMDGQIISFPIATTEKIVEYGVERKVFMPMNSRINKLADMARKWVQLKNKENKDKKIAIILHNMPARNDTIGSAHGLDTINSLYNIINYMDDMDIKLDYRYSSGREIIDELLDSVTNDNRWVSSRFSRDKSTDLVSKDLYKGWFKNFHRDIQEDLEKNWGPIPGRTMVYDGEFLIPGILNGNIFIGLQPSRSAQEDADKTYHSTENPPPHHYQAYYRWIEEVFEADLICHVGTHGTLEWLPGKEVGLYESCFPDINIGSLPHLYIYNIGILGEGMQARRRSNAVILDHMIPSMDRSDTYGGLAEIEDLLEAYNHAVQMESSQVEGIEDRIYNLSLEENILLDLKIDEETFYSDTDNSINKIHNWINQIKNSLVRDGLHIYGEVPKDKRRNNLIRNLLDIKNGDVPSLTDSILLAMGEDPIKIKKAINLDDRDNWLEFKKYNRSVDLSIEIIDNLAFNNYNPDYIDSLIDQLNLTGPRKQLIKTLEFICSDVLPKLMATKDEEKYLKKGIMGGFIPATLGGNPTRGNVNLLPTGRNFYSIDPEKVPTREAYDIGRNLGDNLIESHIAETGKFPESIAIIVYSTNTMKTYGEDIGEILYLMGVRPVYLGNTNRVIGVEAIDLEELARPRIDVTLRISGLFRDTFPNVIHLIDQAVSTVAALDESHEDNFVKKHVDEELGELLKKGINPKDARNQAIVRVFGCPPGTYGAGVSNLIESKNWKSVDDLGRAYIKWSSHGYSRSYQGKIMEDSFKNKLARVELTVKNEVSKEIDILDSDDFYNYHGGLISAITSVRKKQPHSYVGDTSDPELVKNSSLSREVSRIMRSRVLNPKWVEGLKEHGYKGAQDISKMVDIVFGWDATSNVLEDWMYDQISQNFIENKEIKEWLVKENHYAVYNISERLLEASQRGMWTTSKDRILDLQKIHIEMEGKLEDAYK